MSAWSEDGLACGWCYQEAAAPLQLKKTILISPIVETQSGDI